MNFIASVSAHALFIGFSDLDWIYRTYCVLSTNLCNIQNAYESLNGIFITLHNDSIYQILFDWTLIPIYITTYRFLTKNYVCLNALQCFITNGFLNYSFDFDEIWPSCDLHISDEPWSFILWKPLPVMSSCTIVSNDVLQSLIAEQNKLSTG